MVIFPIEIFISFHPNDKDYFEQLRKHLIPFEINETIKILHQEMIIGGEEKEIKIINYIERAKVIIFLISVDFVTAEPLPLEVTRAAELYAEGKVLPIAMLLRPVHWEFYPFTNFHPLPRDKKFLLDQTSTRDEAFLSIAKIIINEVYKIHDVYNAIQEDQFSHENLEDENIKSQITKLINKADSLFKEEQLEEAVLKYQQVLKLNKNSVLAHINIANTFIEKNNYEEAIKEYKEALRLNPENAEAHFGLGFALYEKNKVEEATKELKEALRIKPDFNLAYILLYIIRLKENRLEKSELKKFAEYAFCNDELTQFIFKKMSDKNKAILQGFLEICLYEYKFKYPKDSINKFKETVEFLIKKDDPESLKITAEFQYWIGKLLQDTQKFEEAIVEYRKAIEIDPNHVLAHFYLGDTLSTQKNNKEAINEYLKVLQLKEQHLNIDAELDKNFSAYFYYKFGTSLYYENKFEEAIEQYRKAIHFEPNNGSFYNNLGLALLEHGNFDEAIKQLNYAVLLEPNNILFQNNLNQVQNLQSQEKTFLGITPNFFQISLLALLIYFVISYIMRYNVINNWY